MDSEVKVVRKFEQRFDWWYLCSHALKKCLESLRYTFRRKSLSPKMFPESVTCNMSWQQWRHGVWTCAVSNSSKSAFDGTIPAITTSAWSNFASVTVEMLVFKFDCIALCCFPLLRCFHFVADSLESKLHVCFFFIWPEFVHCYVWFLCLSPSPASKVFIAAQILLLATLHSCYVGQSSCLPDVFRHAGISNCNSGCKLLRNLMQCI